MAHHRISPKKKFVHTVHTAKRMTMLEPAGVKKRGKHVGFRPRTLSRWTSERWISNLKSTKQKNAMTFPMLVRKMVYNFARLQRSLYIRKKRSDSEIAHRTLAALDSLFLVARYIHEKKSNDVQVAVFDGTKTKVDIRPGDASILKQIHHEYARVMVNETAENFVFDPSMYEKLKRNGFVNEAGVADWEEMGYVIPANTLESIKTMRNGRIYQLFNDTERDLFNDATRWCIDRTPKMVYEMRAGVVLPDFFLNDLTSAMANIYAQQAA
jgi:hypothetical protein